ncbi:molybdenum cofactor guanylyltransferase [Arthrobacter echini]|uniref:Molybdenum cofactor guanylyltransferase n=1 Tax=Arthrobacter echini TaxID=1529066 RepID=A0A4S5E5P9_9MICC|nr:molybdenum cofactor guanylyltransferase [Arthrobacter echini]
MRFDAVVLAGGRSSRLGGIPKAGLVLGGRTLLERCCAALAGAQRLVVVGPEPEPGTRRHLAGRPSFVREEPPFAGPAAAVVAGFGTITDPAPWCAVMACDMPRVDELLTVLLEASRQDGRASLVPVDGGRDQPLAALYRSEDLGLAIDSVLARGAVENISMRNLLASVRTRVVPVPPGVTHDVDTPEDARELGIDVP